MTFISIVRREACLLSMVVAVAVADMVAWRCCHFRIPCVYNLLVSAPEGTAGTTRGVVVRWSWSVTLLFLVVSDEKDLEDGCERKQETGSMLAKSTSCSRNICLPVHDGDSQDSLFKSASFRQVWPKSV